MSYTLYHRSTQTMDDSTVWGELPDCSPPDGWEYVEVGSPEIEACIMRREVERIRSTQTVDSISQACRDMLSASDCKVLPDWPYPADIPSWIAFRTQLRTILHQTQTGIDPTTVTLPDPPFSLTL